MMDTAIEFNNLPCFYQPNAVELTDGRIIYDACGRCPKCHERGKTSGWTACRVKPGEIREATGDEVRRQNAALASVVW